MLVIGFDVKLAVEQYADFFAAELGAQRVPDIGRHRRINVFDRVADAQLGVVERNVSQEAVLLDEDGTITVQSVRNRRAHGYTTFDRC